MLITLSNNFLELFPKLKITSSNQNGQEYANEDEEKEDN